MSQDYKYLNHICLLRLSALGDVTLMLPLIHTLRQALPHARITWITSSAVWQLLDGLEGVEFVVLDKPRSLGDYWRARATLAKLDPDVLLCMQASLRANLLYPLIHAPRKIGYRGNQARDGQWLFTSECIPFSPRHLLDTFFCFAEQLGIEQRAMVWNLPLTEQDHAWAAQALPEKTTTLFAINPSASKVERNWPTERYIQLMKTIRLQWPVEFVLTGGPSPEETDLAATIEKTLPFSVSNLVGKTTPKQLAAVLQRADCLVAPDTGPAHIAAAVGTPVIGMYAVAPSSLSAPYLYRHLAIDKFDEAVKTLLGKDPQTIPWGTRVHDPRAMELIEVAEVLSRVSEVMGSSAPGH